MISQAHIFDRNGLWDARNCFFLVCLIFIAVLLRKKELASPSKGEILCIKGLIQEINFSFSS